jgi:hypothetical protein
MEGLLIMITVTIRYGFSPRPESGMLACCAIAAHCISNIKIVGSWERTKERARAQTRAFGLCCIQRKTFRRLGYNPVREQGGGKVKRWRN